MSEDWLSDPAKFVREAFEIGNAGGEADEEGRANLRFDVGAALAFAANYCNATCPCGKVYDNNDCTHFVSHYLAAGGAVFPRLNHVCPDGRPTYAPDLLQALNGAAATYANVSRVGANEVRRGDFGFVGSLDTVTHAFVFGGEVRPTDKPGLGVAKLYGHTNNRCNEDVVKNYWSGVYFRIERA